MDKGRFRLMHLAVKLWMPASALIGGVEHYEVQFNQPHHGLSPEEVADVMHAMFQDGEIVAHWPDWRPSHAAFLPTREQLLLALRGQADFWADTLCYGLTPLGGRLWEEVARPNWDRYVDSSGDTNGKWERICADRARIEELLEASESKVLFPRWKVLSPWRATYWKWLPTGHRVRYKDGAPKRSWPEQPDDWWSWCDDPF